MISRGAKLKKKHIINLRNIIWYPFAAQTLVESLVCIFKYEQYVILNKHVERLQPLEHHYNYDFVLEKRVLMYCSQWT